MFAISIAILGYFLTACEAVISKFLLSSKIKSWKLYVFYIGLLSLFTLVFAPFGLHWYGWKIFWTSFFSGVALLFYLVFLYRELEHSPASVVYVVAGVVASIGVVALSPIFLHDTFGLWELVGIFLLIIGGAILAFKLQEMKFVKGLGMIIIAGLIFTAYLVLLKAGFQGQNFISGYVYSRLGEAVATASLFLSPTFRKEVFLLLKKKDHKEKGKQFIMVTSAKILVGLGALLISIGIFMGSVAVINALIATQYLFIFLLSVVLSFYFKKIFAEDRCWQNVLFKSVGVLLVVVGVVMVSLN